MLNGAARRRMEISLLDTERHPSTEFLTFFVDKESYAICVIVKFTTVVKYVAFFCKVFSDVLPSDFTESHDVPGIPLQFIYEFMQISILGKCSHIPCGDCDVFPPTDLLS